jgi:cytochrome c oxidase subunit I+III
VSDRVRGAVRLEDERERSLGEHLSSVWAPPPGALGFFTAVNHRVVGLRFMVTAFVFFLLAGLLAVAVRLQLSLPLLDVLSPEAYNQAFTMHGSTMMFLFVIPFLEGLAIYLVPLMIGAREMAFPRLNAFGYWVFLVAGVGLYVAYLSGHAPDAGWYNYPPLSGPGYSPGPNVDFWVVLITFLEVSALVAAVEIVVTILKQRAPGMSLTRMPVFVWAMLITALMIVFAMPALILTSTMLGLDRMMGTHFFNVAAGGDPFLWQHLFWFFGHPDVYILLLPGIGAISMIIPTFARRPLAGYTLVVASMVILGMLSFGVWVHHMYTVGLALVGLNFFAAASMLITIPSSIQIIAWITTIWKGRIEVMTTAMLFALAFIVLFILGGITGIMIAAVPFNWQVHDTHFIVAHFHYTMVGGTIFPIFAAIYYWFPKMTGRVLDERLGRWHFWLFLVGFNVTFLLMHVTGLEGMPRRTYTYLPDLGWSALNMISTVGTFIMGAGVFVLLWNVWWSWRVGPVAPPSPWHGRTLEWTTTSPPANYNFLHVPLVGARGSSGEADRGDAADDGGDRPRWLQTLSEGRGGRRENIVTDVLAAEPEGRVVLPKPSPWPFWTAMALSIAFVGALWTPYLVPVGLALTFVALVGWHWPSGTGAPDEPADDELTDRLTGLKAPIVWGVVLLVAIEGTVLALLVMSAFYLRLGAEAWPPQGMATPELATSTLRQGLLVASAVPAWMGVRGFLRGDRRRFLLGLAVGLVLAGGYLVLGGFEYADRAHGWDTHVFGSLDWLMGVYAAFHVVVLMLAAATLGSFVHRGARGAGYLPAAQGLLVYWVFVALGSVLLHGAWHFLARW